MNAYLVHGGRHDVVQEYIDYWARRETSYLIDVVFAETPGQARATFVRRHSECVEFTDIEHTLLLARDVQRARSVATDTDEYWNVVGERNFSFDRESTYVSLET